MANFVKFGGFYQKQPNSIPAKINTLKVFRIVRLDTFFPATLFIDSYIETLSKIHFYVEKALKAEIFKKDVCFFSWLLILQHSTKTRNIGSTSTTNYFAIQSSLQYTYQQPLNKKLHECDWARFTRAQFEVIALTRSQTDIWRH